MLVLLKGYATTPTGILAYPVKATRVRLVQPITRNWFYLVLTVRTNRFLLYKSSLYLTPWYVEYEFLDKTFSF